VLDVDMLVGLSIRINLQCIYLVAETVVWETNTSALVILRATDAVSLSHRLGHGSTQRQQ